MTQLGIDFDITNGTAGSRAAAESIRPHRVPQRERILEFIRSRPAGATRSEIASWLGVALASVCPRCSELQGFPCRNGKLTRPVLIKPAPFTRANGSGIQVEVLVLA